MHSHSRGDPEDDLGDDLEDDLGDDLGDVLGDVLVGVLAGVPAGDLAEVRMDRLAEQPDSSPSASCRCETPAGS